MNIDIKHIAKLARLRIKDVAVQDKFTRQELMQNAPQVKAGCLVVPKTVE